ncbi:MAG TPA: alpha/beta hydrolase [Actinomycetota bacterium]|nr:alpha/beta hydrolase [Actinomycetota bacterium]
MAGAPIVLVPGWWLGAWAWDEVAASLRADGHHVTALTLPGLDAGDTDRSSVSLEDHVDAIVGAISAFERPAVLAVHSGAAVAGHAASDRMPDAVAHLVYVDTGPPSGALDPDFDAVEKPPPTREELERDEPVDGLTDEHFERFAALAVPQPGGPIRDVPILTNDARRDVPSTVIATGYTSEDYRQALDDGQSWLAGLGELRNLHWVDLPTSHWPMWSRPDELARIIGDIAARS